MKKLDHYLESAIQNIEEDRKVTRELLDDVIGYLSKSEERSLILNVKVLELNKNSEPSKTSIER